MIWFTSDLHFGHDKSFLYAPRGFKSIQEHDEYIITDWNTKVDNDDIVYILGDCMLNDNTYGLNCLRRLRGQFHIVLGNHDTTARQELYKTLPNVIELTYATLLRQGNFTAYLSHYPTIIGNFEENFGPICLHGHTHSPDMFQYFNNRCYNVSLDAHDNSPVSIDQVREDIRQHRILNKFIDGAPSTYITNI